MSAVSRRPLATVTPRSHAAGPTPNDTPRRIPRHAVALRSNAWWHEFGCIAPDDHEQSGVMESMLAEIVRRCAAGERVALCVLVRTRGSTPQARGAKMLVLADGKTLGTLGGGCVEAEVRTRALGAINQLTQGDRSVMEFRLDQDYGWDDGLICGGIMDVHVRLLGDADISPFQALLEKLRTGRSGSLQLDYDTPTGPASYTETFGPPPRLLIVGAGHVGNALAALATPLDFRITVIDDRADYLGGERFSPGVQTIAGDIEQTLASIEIDGDTSIVIVTRGHKNDAKALASVIESPAGYIGLIGSKRKIKAILDELASAGVPTEKLERVHAPIGLEIGAVTPAEIALSIAAELVAVRRGRDGQAATPMRMDRDQLRAWASRPRAASSDESL